MKNILIVDDSNLMRNIIKKMFIKHGYRVAGEAENGNMALEKYKELNPDIVTLDITMKGMSGLEALSEILRYDKNAKVVMVSAMGQHSIVKEAAAAGAKGFLVKPFKEEKVISTMENLFK